MGRNRMAITKEIYDATKTMLRGGAKAKDVMRFIGISETSCSHISVASSWEDFCEKRAARSVIASRSRSERNAIKDNKQTDIEPEQHQTWPIMDKVRVLAVATMLGDICGALEAVVIHVKRISSYLDNQTKEV